MQAGKLDQRITIQRKTTTFNTYNEPIEAWADLFTTWAEAITGGGGEFNATQKQYSDASSVFKVRYDGLSSTITELDRITWGGLTYHVLNVDPVNGLRKELLITTRKVS